MHSPLLKMNMENKTTSRTSLLKALLLRAWRERWSDLQWGIHIKTILPRGVNGDVYNLADCILQQAVVGSGANQLSLSYLKHSLSAQVVSYAAVLQRISKFEQFQKSHCILSLLEFLSDIRPGITCRSKPEETLLAPAVLSVIHWLLQVFQNALNRAAQPNGNGNPIVNESDLLEKSALVLNEIVHCEFMMAMCCLAKYNDIELYNETTKKCYEIESFIKVNSTIKIPVPIDGALHDITHLDVDTVAKNVVATETITYCVQALLAIEVLHNPSSPTHVLVAQMWSIKRTKGFTFARLYCEIMRACWLSLYDVTGTSHESQWGAFTFIKVPQLLNQLHNFTKVLETDEKSEFSQDVVDALELLTEHSPLLDNLDVKCSCNCLECLLHELMKLSLITEKHLKYYVNKREQSASNLKLLKSTGSQNAGIPKVIIQAEPTFSGILKTLNTDKIQEPLLRMMYQVLTGKSFELILSVASVEGKLKTFVMRLIKFNECSKQATGELGKTGAMLFDASFLMLTAIVQNYGSESVLDEGGDSFFEQWVRQCMVENGHPKSPNQILKLCEQSKVDALLQQFNSNDADFKNSQVKWHEVCLNIPGVMKEMLFAWEQGALSANDVKRILDVMRQRMCSLAIAATAWLCSYMQIVQQDTLLKPMNMVQQFLTQINVDDNHDNFKERWNLMAEIIRKMQYDVHPPVPNKPKILTIGNSIVSRQPMYEQLHQVWTTIQKRGWIDNESSYTLKCLLNTGGAYWFVMNIIKEIMKFRFQDDLDKSVDLAFAIFHLNIEKCTMALLLKGLPYYLCNNLLSNLMVEPQSTALAKLCAYAIFATLDYSVYTPTTVFKKRSRPEENEDIDVPAPKLMRLNDDVPQSVFQATTPSSKSSTVTLKEPLQSALQEVFKIFETITNRDGFVSQQTYFIFNFINLLVQSGKNRCNVVLQSMPNSLIPYLLRALPELFTSDLLLKLNDINSVIGRNNIASDLCMLRNFALRRNGQNVKNSSVTARLQTSN